MNDKNPTESLGLVFPSSCKTHQRINAQREFGASCLNFFLSAKAQIDVHGVDFLLLSVSPPVRPDRGDR